MSHTVIAVVDDLFFASKIRATAEQLGVHVDFARSADVAIELACRKSPSLVIVDLHSQKIDPFELARRLKADEQLHSLLLLGFFSHVETELQRRAEEAGYGQVLPRSIFSKKLAEILLMA